MKPLLRNLLVICSLLFFVSGWNSPAFAQAAAVESQQTPSAPSAVHDPTPGDVHAADEHHVEHHGLPAAAPEVPFLRIGPLGVTNSMVLTWIVAILIIVFARYATATMKEIPDGVEFHFRLSEEELKKVGQAGALEIIKRYRLTPAPAEDPMGVKGYDLGFEIEIRNVGDNPQEVAYRPLDSGPAMSDIGANPS